MEKFNRSEFMRKRHEASRLQFNKFQSSYPDEKVSYSDFLKNETPLENKFVAYDVSFQINYMGATESLVSSGKTFTVIGLKSQESQIRDRTMNLVLDSKGKTSGNRFTGNTLNAIEGSTDINIKPRGMEESRRKISRADINNALENGFVVKDLDQNFNFKNKKGRTGTMSLDIRHFM